MRLNISKMSEADALKILFWTYFPPYDWYNLEGCDECLDELLKEYYYACKTEEGHLIGFFCYECAAQVSGGKDKGFYQDEDYLDIGLGMHPLYCGKGLGEEFLREGMRFGQNVYRKKYFRLTVATLNERAIRVYERVGFQKKAIFHCEFGSSKTTFSIMTCEL